MENLPRYALSALVAGVATAGASLTLASQAENAPRRSPGQTPLEYWLPPTMVVLAPIACCLPVCCLSLCCLLYRSLPNIRSNRDGAEMNNQRGLNRRNRQSIASERALNQVVVSPAVVSDLQVHQLSRQRTHAYVVNPEGEISIAKRLNLNEATSEDKPIPTAFQPQPHPQQPQLQSSLVAERPSNF